MDVNGEPVELFSVDGLEVTANDYALGTYELSLSIIDFYGGTLEFTLTFQITNDPPYCIQDYEDQIVNMPAGTYLTLVIEYSQYNFEDLNNDQF